jgi:Protein of unknown function (DUF2752)
MTIMRAEAPFRSQPPGARWRRLLPPAGALAAVAAAVTYVRAVDPGQHGHYPTCPFLALTGLYCPGCGSLRMMHALAHGHVAEGFGRNPFAFLLIPVLGYLWTRWVRAAARGEAFSSPLLRTPVIWVLTVLMLVYWVVRNLPLGRALAP